MLSLTQIELDEILSKYHSSNETSEDEEKLIGYVFEELYKKNGCRPEPDQILSRFRDLVSGYILHQMVNKGVLEPYFDPEGEEDTFEFTELGWDLNKQLVGN